MRFWRSCFLGGGFSRVCGGQSQKSDSECDAFLFCMCAYLFFHWWRMSFYSSTNIDKNLQKSLTQEDFLPRGSTLTLSHFENNLLFLGHKMGGGCDIRFQKSRHASAAASSLFRAASLADAAVEAAAEADNVESDATDSSDSDEASEAGDHAGQSTGSCGADKDKDCDD